MLLVAAVVLTVYGVVDGWPAFAFVVGAACVEVSQSLFWIWYSKRRPAQVGWEALIGATAEVVSECRPLGTVRVHGELWQARSRKGAGPGSRVRVRAVDGLTLEVESLDRPPRIV